MRELKDDGTSDEQALDFRNRGEVPPRRPAWRGLKDAMMNGKSDSRVCFSGLAIVR